MQCTLLPDGTSDRALVPIIRWTLRQHLAVPEISVRVADLSRARRPPGLADLAARIEIAIDLNPCDVLFVHRDAEQAGGLETRRAEIEQAAETIQVGIPIIPVVPVRMTEAWLLFDEPAVRAAAGNPAGVVPLDLPAVGFRERAHAK